jgi:UDP-N-acetylglucosamine 1-carboxyvinyltransferase
MDIVYILTSDVIYGIIWFIKIKVGFNMRWIEVKGNRSLRGCLNVPGSKNSSLGILAACCLASEPIWLRNVPDISDVDKVLDIASHLGVKILKNDNYIVMDPRNIHSGEIDPNVSSKYRASYYFIGALLARRKKVSIGYPGGDNFGNRPIDQHIKGFRALGAEVNLYSDYYEVKCEKLIGNDIYFDVITSGATINVMLAAVLAEGKSTLINSARDPEVVDVAIMLNKMGAKIRGMGTSTIVIEGVKELRGCEHAVIPDRLIAGSLIIGAAATRGDITVSDVIPEHLLSCTAKLDEAGLTTIIGDSHIRAYVEGELTGINVKTAMYPGFATDLQQPLTAMLLTANSHSTIVDTIYPNRFNHCIQLNRMGANIILRDGSAIIPGNRKITGSWVHASDVRAGMCLILAGLIAEGTTCITGIEHIERGYPNVVDTFISLGADIKICEDIDFNNEGTLISEM